MGQHIMSPAALPLGTQSGKVNRPDNYFLSRSRFGLGEHAAVEVDNHAASGPAKRRIILKAGRLIDCDHIGHVLQRAHPVNCGPPI